MMRRISKHTGLAVATAVISSVLVIVPSGTANADGVQAVETECAAAAAELTSLRWSCVGTTLAYENTDGSFSSVERGGVVEVSDGDVQPQDDLDSWCETGQATCTRTPPGADGRYTKEIKGNAAFGVGTTLKGTFDVIWRQSFSGNSARYRLSLDWDSGGEVDSDYWRAAIRRDEIGPDPTMDYQYFYPATIRSTGPYRVSSPSSSGYYNMIPLPNNSGETYHDDLYGYFFSGGMKFGASTLRLPDFRCTTQCTYI